MCVCVGFNILIKCSKTIFFFNKSLYFVLLILYIFYRIEPCVIIIVKNAIAMALKDNNGTQKPTNTLNIALFNKKNQ